MWKTYDIRACKYKQRATITFTIIKVPEIKARRSNIIINVYFSNQMINDKRKVFNYTTYIPKNWSAILPGNWAVWSVICYVPSHKQLISLTHTLTHSHTHTHKHTCGCMAMEISVIVESTILCAISRARRRKSPNWVEVEATTLKEDKQQRKESKGERGTDR